MYYEGHNEDYVLEIMKGKVFGHGNSSIGVDMLRDHCREKKHLIKTDSYMNNLLCLEHINIINAG